VQEDAAGKLDLAFEDMSEQQLKNIARPVRAYRVASGPVLVTEPGTPALALPDKPSIAVLPFANMSGDPEQEYFADGMVEEIITALSRIRRLFVIARNSSFTYKGRAVDVKQVSRELGVRYLLEGSVRKSGHRVRITAQLIETETAAHVWADRFDGSLDDIFDLQDRVATSVAGVIEPALQVAEMRRSAARPTTDLSAYDLYLRALAAYFPITKQRIFEALGLLEQAIAIDPHYGLALSLAAICYLQLATNGWVEEGETVRRKACDLARQALQMGENDPGILVNAAFVLARFDEDIDAAIGLVDRALALNPSYARGWLFSGILRSWAGQHDLAIEHLETSGHMGVVLRSPRRGKLQRFRIWRQFSSKLVVMTAMSLGSFKPPSGRCVRLNRRSSRSGHPEKFKIFHIRRPESVTAPKFRTVYCRL
jgi:adenylate cyclase